MCGSSEDERADNLDDRDRWGGYPDDLDDERDKADFYWPGNDDDDLWDSPDDEDDEDDE